MATLFSLADSSFYIELPSKEPEIISRRTIQVETLEGTESRDFGFYSSDSVVPLEVELSLDELLAIQSVVKKNGRVGVSFSISSYEVFIKNIESTRSEAGNFQAKLTLFVVRSL